MVGVADTDATDVPPEEVVTNRVTPSICVPEDVTMDIAPVHVVPAAIPAGLTETVKFVFDWLAVKLPVGERLSQLLLVQFCSVACAVALVLPGAVTVYGIRIKHCNGRIPYRPSL